MLGAVSGVVWGTHNVKKEIFQTWQKYFIQSASACFQSQTNYGIKTVFKRAMKKWGKIPLCFKKNQEVL